MVIKLTMMIMHEKGKRAKITETITDNKAGKVKVLLSFIVNSDNEETPMKMISVSVIFRYSRYIVYSYVVSLHHMNKDVIKHV